MQIANSKTTTVTREEDKVLPTNQSLPDFSREQKLIMLCTSINLNSEQLAEIQNLLNDSLNWEYFTNAAHRNGILPLVQQNLLQKFGSDLPAEVKKQYIALFQEHTRQNLFQSLKLVEIVKLLETAGITSLPFKGPTLALRAYGNLTLRKFADLDVLVQPKDFDKAVDLLSKNGYTANPTERKLALRARQKDIGLISDDRRVFLELHWKLSGSHFALPLEINQLWERLEKINVGGASLNTLPFADLFIYLCLHGSRHGWERLSWICDLQRLIDSEEKSGAPVDWKFVAAHARRHGCERVVELGLYLVREFFDVEVDYPNWKKISANETFEKIAVQVKDKVFAEKFTPTEIGDWYLYHLALKGGKFDRAKLHLYYLAWYLRLTLMPNSLDEAVFHLPRAFYPLYFILRPSRLFYTYLWTNSDKKLVAAQTTNIKKG